MGDEQAGEKRKSFWQSLTGRVTQVVTVITAIGAIVAGIEKSWPTVQHLFLRGAPSEKFAIETRYYPVMPLSLANSIASQDFLYWFYIKVDNKGDKSLHLKITFTVRQGPVDRNIAPLHYTIPPKGSGPLKADPAFTLLNYDAPSDLIVGWLISEEPGDDVLSSDDSKTIRLLPRNIVAWDLMGPDGKPVPRDFLLASLAAWTLTPAPEIRKLAAELRSALPAEPEFESSALRWFAKSYDRCFKSPRGLKVRPILNAFPPAGRQTIRAPLETMNENMADPLEAALFLTALCNAASGELRARSALFAVPETEAAPDRMVFLMAWRAAGRDNWHALDLTHASELTFGDNDARSSSRLAALLKQDPNILKALDSTGTFIKQGSAVVALDFNQAAEHFGIRGLP